MSNRINAKGNNTKKKKVDYAKRGYQSVLILLMFSLLLFLMGFVLNPVGIVSWVPYSIHSILSADYSADRMPIIFPGLRMEVIFDAIEDLGTPIAAESKATLVSYLQGTIPTITPTIRDPSTTTPEAALTLIPTQTIHATLPSSTPVGNVTATPGSIRSLTPSATRLFTATMTPGNSLTATSQASAQPTIHQPTATFGLATSTSTPRSPTPTASSSTIQPSPTGTVIIPPTATRTPTSTPTRTPVVTNTIIPSPTFTSTTRPSPTTPPTPTRTPRPYPEPPTPTHVPYP